MQEDDKKKKNGFFTRNLNEQPSQDTRSMLLGAAFEEIHTFGFQAASLSKILNRTGVTKGALYHHFPNKLELGYAVVDELIRYQINEQWIKPLHEGNPIDQIIQQIHQGKELFSSEDIRLGCPLGNLSQEMSPIDEGFRERIEAIYSEWREGLTAALSRGQKNNQVAGDINPADTATFIVASLEGCLGTAKNAQSMELLLACGSGLIQVLEKMRMTEKNND